MALGTGESQRVGRKVRLKTILTRWGVSRDNELSVTAGLSALNEITGIICLVKDNQSRGTTAAPVDILENTALDTTFNRISSARRFTTLYRRQFTVPSGSLVSNNSGPVAYTMKGGRSQLVTDYIPVDFDVHYSGTGSTSADVTENNILILVYWSNDLAGSLRATFRVKYSDS